MDKILFFLSSLLKKPAVDKDPWAAYRNKGGPISPEAGELMLVVTSLFIVGYMLIKF
jgi:hypothetical protein